MPDALQVVRRAADRRRRAQVEYVRSLLQAVLVLEQAGVRDPFSQVAGAAGVSRQAVRQIVLARRA